MTLSSKVELSDWLTHGHR